MKRRYIWIEDLHDAVDDGFEDAEVGVVVDALLEGEVDRPVEALLEAHVRVVARAWEEVLLMPAYLELVQRTGQHPVRGEEGLLHPVPVVHVDVDVQHPLVLLQELEDRQHAVVHVAETRGLLSLGVVQASRPINRDVDGLFVDEVGPKNGTYLRDFVPLQ
jgi:hypothetical protein